jgi:hypothetical protein
MMKHQQSGIPMSHKKINVEDFAVSHHQEAPKIPPCTP